MSENLNVEDKATEKLENEYVVESELELMKKDPVSYILSKFDDLSILSDMLKDVRSEKKELLSNDDELLEIISKEDELKEQLKPIREEKKAILERIKKDNYELFLKEDTAKKKKINVLNKIGVASAHRQATWDVSPIELGNNRVLTVNTKSTVKKSKVD